MQTIDDLFDSFDGPANVGRAIGKSTEHAFAMRRRKSVPVRYWPKLLRAAHDRGLMIDEAVLVQIHAPAEGATPT